MAYSVLVSWQPSKSPCAASQSLSIEVYRNGILLIPRRSIKLLPEASHWNTQEMGLKLEHEDQIDVMITTISDEGLPDHEPPRRRFMVARCPTCGAAEEGEGEVVFLAPSLAQRWAARFWQWLLPNRATFQYPVSATNIFFKAQAIVHADAAASV